MECTGGRGPCLCCSCRVCFVLIRADLCSALYLGLLCRRFRPENGLRHHSHLFLPILHRSFNNPLRQITCPLDPGHSGDGADDLYGFALRWLRRKRNLLCKTPVGGREVAQVVGDAQRASDKVANVKAEVAGSRLPCSNMRVLNADNLSLLMPKFSLAGTLMGRSRHRMRSLPTLLLQMRNLLLRVRCISSVARLPQSIATSTSAMVPSGLGTTL
jgi:hypothetical protein